MVGANPILYFDGECNLCNRAVQFVIRHDKQKRFRFASLQSAAGEVMKSSFQGRIPDSIVLEYDGVYRVKSSAVLHMLRLLGGGWQLLYAFMIVPRLLRDYLYDFISRHRYQLYGRRDSCMVPTKELQSRFVQ
jgi:predicted DCC family thiol-disulfide oxidoreductase YuxK